MINFSDNFGYIFSMKSYSSYPYGYEYETTPYIFWFSNGNQLSTDCYHVKPIHIVLPSNSINDIKILLDSEIFKMYKIDEENMDIEELSLKNRISLLDGDINKIEDIIGNDSKQYDVYTFYIFSKSNEEGSWFTNALIEITYNDSHTEWCPITIGAAFEEESEILNINANNIGVKLPKSILKAIYPVEYNDDSFDAVKFNEKIKEYLINQMAIKGECGNYSSALNSLKWFEWGENVKLSKLLRTDNEYLEQYIHDYFDINTDILETFKKFINSTYLSLSVDYNKESEITYIVNEDETGLAGEGKPKLIDLFNQDIAKKYKNITYFEKYYKHTLNDMLYKLSCLKYMYKKYFLPIHLSIHSASIKEKVFANDIKLLNVSSVSNTERIASTTDEFNEKYSNVKFENTETYYLQNKSSICDDNYNIFIEYDEGYCENNFNDFYNLSNEICAYIPIEFSGYIKDSYDENGNLAETDDILFDCVLLLNKDDINIYESHFKFYGKNNRYKYFCICPKLFTNDLNKDFWENKIFSIDLLCNGVWYKHTFRLEIPELYCDFGKLKYKYFDSYKQINKIDNENNFIDFNATINDKELVSIFSLDFYTELYNINNDYDLLLRYLASLNDKIHIPDNDDYLNYVKFFKITDIKGKEIEYLDHIAFEDNTDSKYKFLDSTMEIYNDFFDIEGNQKIDFPEYDFYLMHNKTKFYGVIISKDTVLNANKIEIPKKFEFNNKYILTLEDENTAFFINRMVFEKSNGINKFNKNEIVASKIYNNELPYITGNVSRWTFKPYSLNMSDEIATSSKTSLGIMSIPENYLEYSTGYYDVEIDYAIDDYWTHCKKIKSRINII